MLVQLWRKNFQLIEEGFQVTSQISERRTRRLKENLKIKL